VWDQPPAERGDRPPFLALDDDVRLVGRRHVPARPELVGERLRGEDLGELGRRAFLAEATAHRAQV
jgi:hypothetical protein